MFATTARELSYLLKVSQFQMPKMIILIVILWAFNILNFISGKKLNVFGIYPRSFLGLLGIFFSPILHANFNHLFFNTIPLLILGILLMAISYDNFIQLSFFVIFFGGFGVWLLARKAIHLGASGVISGYFSYALFLAYKSPSAISIFLAFIAFYYFGGILFGIIPQKKEISWESHLSGFIAGIIFATLI